MRASQQVRGNELAALRILAPPTANWFFFTHGRLRRLYLHFIVHGLCGFGAGAGSVSIAEPLRNRATFIHNRESSVSRHRNDSPVRKRN